MIIKIEMQTDQGGIYNILKVIVVNKMINQKTLNKFTTNDMSELTGLSRAATSRSLNNLVKIGVLYKMEEHDSNNIRRVFYKLNGDEVLNFVRNVLYN